VHCARVVGGGCDAMVEVLKVGVLRRARKEQGKKGPAFRDRTSASQRRDCSARAAKEEGSPHFSSIRLTTFTFTCIHLLKDGSHYLVLISCYSYMYARAQTRPTMAYHPAFNIYMLPKLKPPSLQQTSAHACIRIPGSSYTRTRPSQYQQKNHESQKTSKRRECHKCNPYHPL